MSSISGLNINNSSLRPLVEAPPKVEDSGSSVEEQAETAAPAEGVKVSISGIGLAKANSAAGGNSDIDESGLPDSIKSTLKMIRDLQKRLDEKMAELQAVMADQSISPEQAKVKMSRLQSEIASINAGLIGAITSLNKSMKDLGLSSDDMMKVASLLS